MKKHLWGILYGLLLIGFTAFVMLDTFVIPKAYSVVETEITSEISATEAAENNESFETEKSEKKKSKSKKSPKGERTKTENKDNDKTDTAETETSSDNGNPSEKSYEDENIKITITQYREYDSEIYVADVILSSPEYLKTALAKNTYGKNITEKTSEIAENKNSILAVNGDYYGAQNKGYVVRGGVLYRNTASKDNEDLVIYNNGSFEIISEKEITAEQLLENGAKEVLSFGPALVENGEIAVDENDEVGKAKASNPRTAIGIIDELHYVFVVSDGRTDESKGLSLYQLAQFMQGLDTKTAYNLDGGGSSTMYFNGEIINNPTTSGNSIKERSVSDIVYIGY